MKYLDITFQSCVILLGLISGINTYETNDWPGALLITQLVLGPWQFFSSVFSVAAGVYPWKWKCWHLIASTIYLLVVIILAYMKWLPDSGVLSLAILTVPAWSLAIYYYTLTWQWVLYPKRKAGGFLPNINF